MANLISIPKTQAAASLIVLAGVLIVIATIMSPSNSTVVEAEITESLEQQLQTDDYIHLIVTDHLYRIGGKFGVVTRKEEIWIQRPSYMRAEEN